MSRWGHAARSAAAAAVAVGAMLAGVQPALGAQAPPGSNTLQEFLEVTQHGDYAAGGTGMLGTGTGEIVINGVLPGSTVTAAYLYWAIVAPAQQEGFDDGLFNGVPITGVLVATGADPCRDPDSNDAQEWSTFVYRADVSALVTPAGNGSYTLAGFASGALDPNDPFGTSSAPPINEGATLVVLHENPVVENRVIALYEGAATTDVEHDVTLVETTLRFAAVAEGDAHTTYGIADGQFFFSDETLFNSVVLSRNEETPGSADGDEGPNNDTDLYDVSALVNGGDTSARVALGNGTECLVHFLQVFSAPAGAVAEPVPATLTLTPPTAVVEIGQQHTVTATVTTVDGAPVAGVLVQFAVTGSVSTTGSCVTDVNGQCTFTFDGPALPGAVTITAYADVNKNGVQEPGEPTGAATATFVVPQSTPLCEIRITYGGWLYTASASKASFGGNGKADQNRGTTGQTEHQDHGLVPFRFHGNVVAVVCNGQRGIVFAEGQINGAGATVVARIDVTDVADPGTNLDTYWFQTTGYDSGGLRPLEGGNIQVVQQA